LRVSRFRNRGLVLEPDENQMNIAGIKHIQERIGVVPDGFWGPKSIAACKSHLLALMPNPNPWPKSDQASLTAFYGRPGDESNLVRVPAPVPMFYDGQKVTTLYCHKKVAASLCRALTAAFRIAPATVQDYYGIYNNRVMRGGSLPSLHARGAAIDLDADNNGNLQSWPVSATMPLEVMECFAREGWLPLGAFILRDAMHMQATQ
jgi:hypothetical protein